jgi:hypothetical protein
MTGQFRICKFHTFTPKAGDWWETGSFDAAECRSETLKTTGGTEATSLE